MPNSNPKPTAQEPIARRRIKLIKPRIQLKLIGVFLGLSSLGFLMQSLHVGLRLSELAASIPEGGSYLIAVLPELPLEILAVSFGMLLPLTVAVGVIATFRIAGPLYHFEKFLKDVLDGNEVHPCRLRQGDQLNELCELINAATAEARMRNANERDSDDRESEADDATEQKAA